MNAEMKANTGPPTHVHAADRTVFTFRPRYVIVFNPVLHQLYSVRLRGAPEDAPEGTTATAQGTLKQPSSLPESWMAIQILCPTYVSPMTRVGSVCLSTTSCLIFAPLYHTTGAF